MTYERAEWFINNRGPRTVQWENGNKLSLPWMFIHEKKSGDLIGVVAGSFNKHWEGISEVSKKIHVDLGEHTDKLEMYLHIRKPYRNRGLESEIFSKYLKLFTNQRITKNLAGINVTTNPNDKYKISYQQALGFVQYGDCFQVDWYEDQGIAKASPLCTRVTYFMTRDKVMKILGKT